MLLKKRERVAERVNNEIKLLLRSLNDFHDYFVVSVRTIGLEHELKKKTSFEIFLKFFRFAREEPIYSPPVLRSFFLDRIEIENNREKEKTREKNVAFDYV